jgi:hypothetical protein
MRDDDITATRALVYILFAVLVIITAEGLIG